MSDIAVGVIGTGGMGTRHAMNLHKHIVGARVAGVYDLDQTRAAKVAADCGGAVVFDSPYSLINSNKIEAVVIVSPDDTHAEFAMVTLKAGKPMLCEKPLGVTVTQAQQVVEAEQALGKTLLSLGFMRRFDPQHVGVKQAATSGQIGRPMMFKGYSRAGVMPVNHPVQTLFTNSIIHDIDAMRWLMAQEVDKVFVQGGRARPTCGPNSYDLLLIQMTLSGGGLAGIEIAHNVDYGYDIYAEVIGELGAAETLQTAAAGIRTQQQGTYGIHVDWLSRFQPAYVIEFQEWIDSLRAQRPFSGAKASDGLQAVRIAFACLQSLQTGLPVTLS